MLTHDDIWHAIDRLAQSSKLSVSGLARRAGLDPTSFNKSKRTTREGRPRWPSTESIAKALVATNTSLDRFMEFVGDEGIGGDGFTQAPSTSPVGFSEDAADNENGIPLIGLAEAGAGGYFDDGGFPSGQGWDTINLPTGHEDGVYALTISGDSMLPLYRDGDVIIVSPTADARKGDRVVVKTLAGEVMAKLLGRKTVESVELISINRDHEDRVFAMSEVEWIARIVWASQ